MWKILHDIWIIEKYVIVFELSSKICEWNEPPGFVLQIVMDVLLELST